MQGKKYKKNKKRKASGGLLNQQQPPSDQAIDALGTAGLSAAGLGPIAAPIVQGGNMLNQAITGDGTDWRRNTIASSISPISRIKSLASGNAKEAIPIVGDIAKARRMKGEKLQQELAEQRALNLTDATNQRAVRGFKNGGKLLAKRLQVQEGGNLQAVSNDAVEVNADQPNKTDSVELNNAFVDNNEIIDNQNRVFSDELKAPNGRTIAKEAKKLEKMKGKNARFTESNAFIDSKLDNLFAYQESMKVPSTNKLNNGGVIKDPIVFGGESRNRQMANNIFDAEVAMDIIETPGLKKQVLDLVKKDRFKESLGINEFAPYTGSNKTQIEVMKKFNLKKGGKIKGAYANGGLTGKDFLRDLKQNEEDLAFYNKYTSNLGTDTGLRPIDTSNLEFPRETASTPRMKNSISQDQILDGVSTISTLLPNIINTRLQKKLKGPARPLQESSIQLKRIDPTAQLNSVNRASKQAQGVVRANTAQSSNLVSSLGSILSKRLEAENQVFGQTNNMNTQISNQESFTNLGTRAKNIDRLNQFNADDINFKNRKLGLTSENVANLSGKIQAMNRERNMRSLDKEKFDILMERYGEFPDVAKSKYKTFKGKKGGKLPKKAYY